MKKIVVFTVLVFAFYSASIAQKYITKEGEIELLSKTSLFTIEAKNQKVASILNAENGEVVASTLVRSFKFREALVEEHFNENYMESHKFPKAQFKGKITNFSDINLSKPGTYKVMIEGNLTMHGETNPVSEEGELTVTGSGISAKVDFYVSLEKFKILVEEKYKDRINDEVKLMVAFDYKQMN